MTVSSETANASTRQETAAEDYFTFVEGVGNIPRDIYKHVLSDPTGDLPRYSPHIVIQHILIVITFMVLVLTGLPVYYSDLFWAPRLISLFGGADTARLVHRVAAFTMIFTCVYHIVTIVAGTVTKILDREFDYRRTQIPRPKDLLDLYHDMKYFFGLEPYRPKMEKFMYKQKMHYLAIIWGNAVLITAGLALLYPDIMARIFPETLSRLLPVAGQGEGSFAAFFQELARLMHADEAVMALLVISFWHLLNVHFVPGRFPFQWAFLTGRITREHQIEEHFLEYIRKLEEIPSEREYMKNLLIEKGYAVTNRQAVSMSDLPRIG